MYNQVFGKFLVYKGIVTEAELERILKEQQNERVKLGTIAVTEGLMTSEQVEEVNHLQIQMDKRFGDIAVEKGYLDEEQVGLLLSKQGNSYMKFMQILMDGYQLELDKIEELAAEFQKEYGFSDSEITALKEDDFDNVVPAFVYSSKPYVVELVALVLRNLVRFVNADFYIGNVKRVTDFTYKSVVGQRLFGQHKIYLAFATDDDEAGMIELASEFAGVDCKEMNNEMYDAIGEFANICNGLLATDLAERNITVDMDPPFIYLNQEIKGRGYIIPLYIHGKLLQIFIAVDENVSMGTEQYMPKEKIKVKTHEKTEGKKTVVIVDDSIFIRRTLRVIMEELGYAVVAEAADGEEGLLAYKEHNPDVLTLDITMPVMDGITALRQIMDYDKEANVIMVTAAGQQTKVIECLKIGAKKFIMKPFDKNEIEKSLADI